MNPKRRRVAASPGSGGSDHSTDHQHEPVTLEGEFPRELRRFLPPGTAETWTTLASLLPPSAYLAGGTALTVHLRHRVSRDLDFMLAGPEDLTSLRRRIEQAGRFAVSQQDPSTLNGVFESTKVQFLGAYDQRLVGELRTVGGISVASVEDLMAMKLKVIVDRGELRDYFDLMEIDRRGLVTVEEGLALFAERYSPPEPDGYVSAIIRSLGYLGDVADDPSLPIKKATIERYWARRQPALWASVSRW